MAKRIIPGTGEHRKVRKSCKKCKGRHTKHEDDFHGMGAHEYTHPGYCSINCCGSQDDSPCYNPKTRAEEAARKRKHMRKLGYKIQIGSNKRARIVGKKGKSLKRFGAKKK